MTRFADGPVVQVATEIAASTDVVWGLVTDINLPSRFQDEFLGAEWLDDGPAPGARFSGRNQRRGRRWETTSWVVAFERSGRSGGPSAIRTLRERRGPFTSSRTVREHA
jgi:hypothetical protein